MMVFRGRRLERRLDAHPALSHTGNFENPVDCFTWRLHCARLFLLTAGKLFGLLSVRESEPD